MEHEILKSEEHFSEASLKGAKEAKVYLEELLSYPDSGLLEHEIIITVNKNLLRNNKGGYSPYQRLSTYKGLQKLYCNPQDIYNRMQIIIDHFNEKCYYHNSILESLTEFIFDFLEIHPFSDGNGRTIKFLVWYVLKAFNRLNSFHCLDYHIWCEIIHRNCYHQILSWLKSME